MSRYEFLITDKAGNTLATLDGAGSRSYSIYLNKSGEARFTLAPTDPKLTADLLLLGHKELKIKRDGTLVWGGELVYSRTDLSAEEERVEIAAKGYLNLLSYRYVGTTAGNPTTYTDEDLADIAHDLITDSQALSNGDYGITLGANPISRNGDRTYDFRNLLEALEGLSNDNVDNGIDFEITPDKTFNAYYPKKGRQLDSVVFEWGVNVDEFFEIKDATRMVNQAIVLGSGEGNSMITATRNDTNLQETYKLRQDILYHKSVVKQSTLEEHGDRALFERGSQSQIIGVKTRGDLPPSFGSYQVGDTVRVKIKHGIVNIDSYWRIYGIEVRVGDEDEEEITVIFNQT